MAKYTVRIRYPLPREWHASKDREKERRFGPDKGQFDVLTPDGGVIECKNEAAARRVADDMNALCQYACELEQSVQNTTEPMPQIAPALNDLLKGWFNP